MSAPRLGLRALRRSAVSLRTNGTRFTQRRWQTDAAAAPVKEESTLSKFWNSPVGPKTVHFWAPIMKARLNLGGGMWIQWGLVLAGAADFARPASQLSLSQNLALMATGTIWTRWCFVIKPRNLFLASVNFLLACVGSIQVSRVLMYQRSLKNESTGEAAKELAGKEREAVEKIVKEPESVARAVAGQK